MYYKELNVESGVHIVYHLFKGAQKGIWLQLLLCYIIAGSVFSVAVRVYKFFLHIIFLSIHFIDPVQRYTKVISAFPFIDGN